MASRTETVAIPSSKINVTAQDTGRSRDPISELGTLDRLDSPGTESSISQATYGPFSPPPSNPPVPGYLRAPDSGDVQPTRERSKSNLSPPQQQGEWSGRTSGEYGGRARSNSATRYYTQARDRSGTVSSVNEHNHNAISSQGGTRTMPTSPPQTQHAFSSPTPSQQPPLTSATLGPVSPPPSTAVPPYASQAPSAAAFSPQPQMQPQTQPDANPLAHAKPQHQAPAEDPTMVTSLEHLGNDPALVDCPRCQMPTRTAVTKEAGDAVTLWAVVLCCLTGVLCAWLPCVINDCKDTVHRCSQCQLLLATVTSSGAVRVAQGINKPVASQYARQPQMEAGPPPPQQQQQQQQQWEQQRDQTPGPAPAYWESQQQQWGKPAMAPAPNYAPQEVESVPLVEMEATPAAPVELPAEGDSETRKGTAGSNRDEKKELEHSER